MKKAASIIAVMVMSLGLFSCEADTPVEETDAFYETLNDADANDGDQTSGQGRGT